MVRTHSSYTASPARFRSPQRGPACLPSQDGSQYEMDLDALGLNSTFESTELEGIREPPIDHLETSEIEGPEDFTMNMTYWMTADLSPAQIKSRKEARQKVSEIRMDAANGGVDHHGSIVEGGQAKMNTRFPQQGKHSSTSASPARRTDFTTDERVHSTPASERSMENDEKVRSFLSALPDTDMEGALTGTPLHGPRNSFLQVPKPLPSKLPSLQATVEDYDTPRKPTQETVIHHASPLIDTTEYDATRLKIAELQAQMEQQALESKIRIAELKTILSFTRTELEESRTENYRHKENLAMQKKEHAEVLASTQAQAETLEHGLHVRMQEYREEMRLQNSARLENQLEEFERITAELKKSKETAIEEASIAHQSLRDARLEIERTRNTCVQELQHTSLEESVLDSASIDQSKSSRTDRLVLSEQLSLVQARAEQLQSSLDEAIADARAAREASIWEETTRKKIEAKAAAGIRRVVELENNLQAVHFELECARADASAKQQLFNTNAELNARLRTCKTELDAAKATLHSSDQQGSAGADLERRVSKLVSELRCARSDLSTKDRQMLQHAENFGALEQQYNTALGRAESLESSISALRRQLAEAHRDSSKNRTEVERLDRELEDANERLHDVRVEGDRRVESIGRQLSQMREAKQEAEKKFREFQSKHDDLVQGHGVMMEDVRDKAEDAVRKAGALLEHERIEKRRLIKEFKKCKEELARLEQAATQNADETANGSDDDSTSSISETAAGAKDTYKSDFGHMLRKLVAENESLNEELTGVRKQNQGLRARAGSSSELQKIVASLEAQVKSLSDEKAMLQYRLQSQEEDFQAVNSAMDEKLAVMVSQVMKEKAKTVVGKRDGQWVLNMGKAQKEKELMGKVLMRQWGREEVGVADEDRGQKQKYMYKHLQ